MIIKYDNASRQPDAVSRLHPYEPFIPPGHKFTHRAENGIYVYIVSVRHNCKGSAEKDYKRHRRYLQPLYKRVRLYFLLVRNDKFRDSYIVDLRVLTLFFDKLDHFHNGKNIAPAFNVGYVYHRYRFYLCRHAAVCAPYGCDVAHFYLTLMHLRIFIEADIYRFTHRRHRLSQIFTIYVSILHLRYIIHTSINFLMRRRIFFSRRDTCTCDIPSFAATSLCVLSSK